MKANKIINILESDFLDLMERWDNTKDKKEKEQIGLLAEHTVNLLTQIKGTVYGKEFHDLYVKYIIKCKKEELKEQL